MILLIQNALQDRLDRQPELHAGRIPDLVTAKRDEAVFHMLPAYRVGAKQLQSPSFRGVILNTCSKKGY